MTAAAHRHCDSYIDDADAPEALRLFLRIARSPGHGSLCGGPPALFATLREDVPAYKGRIRRDASGHVIEQTETLGAGVRIRIVMASRMGDVGITTNLRAVSGYDARVQVDQLEDFSEQP